MTWPPSQYGLSDYMNDVWRHSGKNLCAHCQRPIYQDHDSGYWIHAEHEKADGRNGLHCSPDMWENKEIRKYALPVERIPVG